MSRADGRGTHADADSFEGTVKVKLGPIALVYKGAGDFVDKDGAAHRMTIAAKGKDKRGNGTAGADVVVTMTAEGDSATRVEVVTDLNVTGKPAQFGRGVMQDVSDALLGQFVDCLAGRFEPAADEAPATPAPESAPAPASEAAPAAATTPVPASAGTAAAPPTPAAPTTPAPAARPATRESGSDAIDLGATALPALLRAYGPHLAAALGWGVALLLRLRRRRD